MNIATEIGSKPERFKNNKHTNKFQAKMRNDFVEIRNSSSRKHKHDTKR